MFSGEFKFGDGSRPKHGAGKARENLDHPTSPVGLRAKCPVCAERLYRNEPATWRMGRYICPDTGAALVGIAHVGCLS